MHSGESPREDMEFSESAEALLARMRDGDRSAAARFMEIYGLVIRLRVRDKLSVGLRRVMDSEDVLSTVARRLDGLVVEGRLRAQTAPELWSLVQAVALHAVLESNRAGHRDPESLTQDLADTAPPPNAPEADTHGFIDEAMDSLGCETDQRVLNLWLRGSSHASIARSMGVSPSTIRMRWLRVMRTLRSLGRGEHR